MNFGFRIANRLLLIGLLICGCDSKPKESPPPPAREIAGSAVVRGRVTFTGTVPVMHEIDNSTCHEGAPGIREETVLVSPTGGLKNVLVTIEGIGPGAPHGDPPMLDQLHCTYVPHVMGVTVGQLMVIRTSDPTIHNIHISGSGGDILNFALPRSGQEKAVSFKKPDVLRAKCDVHPWMTAYIAVVENPFFAVTGDDGSFEIKNVPAGTYKLATWHEQYGRLEQPITLDDAKPAEVNLTYGKK